MPKTENRAYKKKGGTFRDARRFFIVAEGDREDGYFSWFQDKNPRRLIVEIIERQGFGSAPQNMLKRLGHFLPESARLEGDQIWVSVQNYNANLGKNITLCSNGR